MERERNNTIDMLVLSIGALVLLGTVCDKMERKHHQNPGYETNRYEIQTNTIRTNYYSQ